MTSSKTVIKQEPASGITLSLNWKSGLWIALFIFIIFTRFHHLGDKPFHHDESLYGKYIWNFYVGQGYHYDPMQHGPFMFHMEQIPLFLFGVNNYTIRILPASTGFFLILALFLMRKKLKEEVALLAGWIFAINPVFMYFQRFLRHDAFFSLFSILILFFIVLWIKDRKPWQAYLLAGSLSILYCIKENAFVYFLTLFSFAIFKVISDALNKENGERVGFKALGNNFHSFPFLSKMFIIISLWGTTFVIYALGNQFFKSKIAHWENSVHTYWYAAFALYVVFAAFFVIKGEQARSPGENKSFLGLKPEFFLDSHIFAISLFVFAGIFILLYTTFFTNMNGFWGGIYKWYTYWLHQHSIARIRGPFHYYHHQMLIYAFLPLSITLIGLIARSMRKAGYVVSSIYIILFIGAELFARSSKSPWPLTKADLFTNEHLVLAIGYLIAGIYCVFTYLKDRAYLKGFLTWWTVMAYLVYSYLQEKVPWLTMHIITPMILLAAIFLYEIFTNKEQKWARNIMAICTGIMVIYSLHTSFQLCWHNEANPTEQMVYVQTTPDVPKIISELERISFWTGDRLKLPIVIDGNATWPFYWYLRDWKAVTYGKMVDPKRHLVVICDWEARHTFNDKLDNKYVAHRFQLRAWYLPTRNDLKSGNMLRNIWRWVLLREKFKENLYGSQDVCMFVRKDVAKYAYGVKLGEKPVTPKKKKAPPTNKSTTRANELQFGRFGSSNGLFNEPKGIAVAGNGNIYVVDSKNHRIQKFSPDGKFITAWGEKGKGDGQFDNPTGIALDSQGYVYVADTWNHRIQKFDANGKFIFKFGDSSVFWAPKNLVVDAEGNIFVVNTGYHSIQKYDKNGQKVWSVGSKGSARNQFTEPVGIAMDSVGKLYVCDTANQRVCIYDNGGHFLKDFNVYGWDFYYTEPFIALDEVNKEILVSDSRGNRIEVFDMNGNFKTFWGKEGSQNGAFKLPIGLAVKSGKIFVTESGNHRVQVFRDSRF